MAELRSQISIQLQRFLMIQNAVDDASEDTTGTMSRHIVSTRLEVLEANWHKFQRDHDQLCQGRIDVLESEPYMKHKTFERCQEFYVQAKAALLGRQEAYESTNSSSCTSEIVTANASGVQPTKRRRNLPNIGLPTFSGDYHAWRSFHDLFLSMVGNNEDIPDVEKMHYLKTCLSGDASKLVANLKISDDAFPRAWKLLVSRYDNKRVLISAQLDNLFSLKPIKSKSAKDLNTMLATITECMGALKALGCNTEAWDPLLVHQMARLLDEDTREAWEVKLGRTTTYPTFTEFEDFLIGHTRAWESLASTSCGFLKDRRRSGLTIKPDPRSRSLVAVAPSAGGNVECRLCKSEHYISVCPTYLSLPSDKRKRAIMKLNLCFNCLRSHAVKQCQSPRRCKKCGQKHHTTIHDTDKLRMKSGVQGESKTTSSDSAASLPSTSRSS